MQSKGRGLDKKGRRLYEKTYGKIPEGFHVHHKNGDHIDNTLDNLMLMRGSEHLAWHNLKKIAEDAKKNWTKRPIWARYKKLENGPFICVFNNDGSSKILYKSSYKNEDAHARAYS